MWDSDASFIEYRFLMNKDIRFIPLPWSSIGCRRKFRSQTSDNMDRWKSRGESSHRRETVRRERVSRKKMQVNEKVEKSRDTVFFQCFVSPEGRKVGSLKRRVRSHLVRWEMKNCTPMSKCPKHIIVGALLEVELLQRCVSAVARSTCPS